MIGIVPPKMPLKTSDTLRLLLEKDKSLKMSPEKAAAFVKLIECDEELIEEYQNILSELRTAFEVLTYEYNKIKDKMK